MSHFLLQRRAAVRFLVHAQGFVRMAWCGVVPSKQWIVIKFLSAGKESAIYVHKRLEMCASANAADKGTVSLWASQIAGSEKGQAGVTDKRRYSHYFLECRMGDLVGIMSRGQAINSDLHLQAL
jgi:hypothetical protein